MIEEIKSAAGTKPSWRQGKRILIGITAIACLSAFCWPEAAPTPRAKNIEKSDRSILKDSIDKKTGLIIAPGHQLVVKNCLKCHSPQLITAKRASREGWLATIRWMQHGQGLWDLGAEEPVILDYLANNYAPTNEGRRPPLKNIEWYKLEK